MLHRIIQDDIKMLNVEMIAVATEYVSIAYCIALSEAYKSSKELPPPCLQLFFQ
ncbi:MAG: hypothetical protein ACTS8R_04085 [Arsenophonus sp. NC-QC1-MAG3]